MKYHLFQWAILEPTSKSKCYHSWDRSNSRYSGWYYLNFFFSN